MMHAVRLEFHTNSHYHIAIGSFDKTWCIKSIVEAIWKSSILHHAVNISKVDEIASVPIAQTTTDAGLCAFEDS